MNTTLKWMYFITYINRYDLLIQTLDSIQNDEVYNRMLIIDSSFNNELTGRDDFVYQKNVLTPHVKITCPQAMNLAISLAIRDEIDVLLMSHTDIKFLTPDSINLMLEHIETIKNTRWGLVYVASTLHLMAFNVKAFKEIGWIDAFFVNYFSDNDFLYRFRLANYSVTVFDGIKTEHFGGGSNTIHSDPELLEHNYQTFPLWERYYIQKWGGKPGNERYTVPFNNPKLKDYMKIKGVTY